MFRRLVLALFLASVSHAADIPGGLVKDAHQLTNNTYELLLSPAVQLSPSGAYLNSEIRYQPSNEIGTGFGFGAGELGFNFGVNGTWYFSQHLDVNADLSLLGGMYFNRLSSINFFVLKLAPMISKRINYSWGTLTPYGGVHLTPSFRLSQGGNNEISLKASLGTQVAVAAFDGLKLWAEFGFNLAKSANEIVLGVSYPFAAL